MYDYFFLIHSFNSEMLSVISSWPIISDNVFIRIELLWIDKTILNKGYYDEVVFN